MSAATTEPVAVPSAACADPNITKLGQFSVILLGINSILGAGIFLTPGAVVKIAGPLAPVAYVVAALFAGVLAMVFATAARYVKTNGASYAYTTAAFGQKLGIYAGVTHAVAASIAWGILSSFFVSTLLVVIFPHTGWAEGTAVISVKTLGFLICIAVLLLINTFGNRLIAWANAISTIGKVSALTLFIVGGLWIIVTEHLNNYRSSSAQDVYQPESYAPFGAVDLGQNAVTTLVLATIAALYAFTGFESIANAAEEMKDPERTLPRAIPVAIATVAVAYTLAVVVGMTLGAGEIAHSQQIVKLPAAIGDDVFRTIITIGALVSMFGINLAGSAVSEEPLRRAHRRVRPDSDTGHRISARPAFRMMSISRAWQ
ncbi:APC family permease [Mycobacterium shigaense]|uniref:Permease n=1 Tax=Mycobacterium shigaense TaxID=722731 RepID=A0A1Z4EP60_9MYCO|nr:APC family permease [Mycobacterium shigaense]BAX94656.1 permease [Mycobacterium shigaense]